MSNLTAVIANYYESRQKYLPEIMASLRTSTRRPERVIVWDNTDSLRRVPLDERIHLVRSSQNTMLGRYAAIFLCETDYVFVQDNDLVISPTLIERLFTVARDHQDKIVGVAGCRFVSERTDAATGKVFYSSTERPYSTAHWVQEGPCDVVLGRCWLAHRKALAPGFARILSENVKPGRADDIFMSLAGNGGIVVPCEIQNLDEQGEGLSHEPQHFEERDDFARMMLETRR